MRNLVLAVLCSAAVGMMAVKLDAAPAQKVQKKPGSAQKKGFGKGQGGQKGQKGQRGQRMDPARIAARMIQQFDRNGDKALNVQELSAALKAMREQRGQRGSGAGKGGPGAGKGKGGPGKGGFGKGKGGKAKGGQGKGGPGAGKGKSGKAGKGKVGDE